ncbi:MAG: winged helix-turn-helix transcriptional regulator [Dehalococcoidia bacterium]|nr:winged helix-turn-helix transcriptional regulator [Dehalococcoidia bacterium]
MAVTQVIELPLAEQLPVEQLGACCAPLTEAPISAEDAELAAHVFKALADPARVRLLSMIAAGDPDGTCVCDLNEAVDLAQPTVSHHLKVMLDAGLLERERRASWAYYRLRPGVLQTLATILGG